MPMVRNTKMSMMEPTRRAVSPRRTLIGRVESPGSWVGGGIFIEGIWDGEHATNLQKLHSENLRVQTWSDLRLLAVEDELVETVALFVGWQVRDVDLEGRKSAIVLRNPAILTSLASEVTAKSCGSMKSPNFEVTSPLLKSNV
jgi:hypothetical protein